MANSSSDYYSSESLDFLADYKKKTRKDSEEKLEEHLDVIQAFGEDYERAYMLLNTWQAEAYKDYSYYLGNQWSLEEISYLNDQRRSSFTYNKIRKYVSLYEGIQRKNRLATRIESIDKSGDETATIFTDTMQSIMMLQNGYEAISEAFKGALIGGLTFISPYMDYREDPVSGDVRFHVNQWNQVISDPFWTKRTLEDCSFISRRKFLSRPEVKSLFPKKAELIESLPYGQRDDKFTYLPYARQWGMQRLMNYTEYWRAGWDNKDVLVDMRTGETKEWKGDRQRLKMLRDIELYWDVIKKPVRSVELGIIVEGELLYYGKDPSGLNRYPFVPFTCVFEPSYDLWEWKLQGLVRILRDSQTEVNKRRSKMIDLLDKSLGASWLAKQNAVTNPSSLYQTGQGQVVFLKDTAQMTDVQRLDNQGIHPSMFQIEAELEKDMAETLGVSSEMFGMAENEKIETAGVLAKMRQSASLVAQQGIFDGLRESQKILGEMTLELVQANYTPEKIASLTRKQPTPEFYSKNFLKYHVVVEEGVLTDSQRQAQFVGLVALRNMGIQLPDGDAMIIENSNLHDKKPIAEKMAQMAQAQAQQQQQAAQLQMQQMATQTNVLNSKAESDRALAAERLNKVGLDAALSAERIARAEDEEAAEALNFIKALKELQGMDLTNLKQKIEIVKSLSGKSEEIEPLSSSKV